MTVQFINKKINDIVYINDDKYLPKDNDYVKLLNWDGYYQARQIVRSYYKNNDGSLFCDIIVFLNNEAMITEEGLTLLKEKK